MNYLDKNQGESLIPYNINENNEPVVNARDLHKFLQTGRDFSTWIKDRIEKYDFIEGEDFSPELVKTPNGRPLTEYFITLDMAKELAMVENNELGKQARKYFIKVEKEYKNLILNPETLVDMMIKDPGSFKKMFDDYFDTKQKLIENENVIHQLEKDTEKYKEASKMAYVVSSDDRLFDMGEVSRILKFDGGRNKLFSYLRNKSIFTRVSNYNQPYQSFIDRGYFEVIHKEIAIKETITSIPVCMVTGKGLKFIYKKLKDDGRLRVDWDDVRNLTGL